MRAIVVREFGGPEQLRLETVPDPAPAAGQVVIQVHAAGVNPVDCYVRTGTYAFKPALPYTPGWDAGGVVLRVGDGVTGVKPGDRVYTSGAVSGTYAEQCVCTEAQVHRLPDNVSFEQGAAIGVPYATAYRALFQRAQALAGETVLVHGATGGVGLAAVQLARAHGMTVIGTGGTDRGRQLARDNGAHHALDHHADVAAGIAQLTAGRGVDLILEMLANKNLAADLKMLAMRGRVVVIGNRGTIEINPRDTMGREAAILGMALPNAQPHELAAIHAGLRAALESGVARPVVSRTLPLAEAGRAQKDVLETSTLGKLVLQTAS